jgi:hypothetical protein
MKVIAGTKVQAWPEYESDRLGIPEWSSIYAI